jgi:hypothetical protein
LFILLMPVIGLMFTSMNPDVQFLAMVPCGFGVLTLAMAVFELWRWVTAHNADMFSEHQSALSVTPLVLLSNNLKTMHPEAVKVLNRFGVRTSWQVRVDASRGVRDWVLADSNVHFGLIEFVLSRSNGALYPKNRFSEGSKKWDPDGLVEDRTQYEELEKWLHARLMVTRSFGEYKPAEFIPPWTPELILETMGLTGEQDLYKPEEGSTFGRSAIGGQLGLDTPMSTSATRPPVKREAEVRQLSDEELELVRLENERYAGLYADGKLPS